MLPERVPGFKAVVGYAEKFRPKWVPFYARSIRKGRENCYYVILTDRRTILLSEILKKLPFERLKVREKKLV